MTTANCRLTTLIVDDEELAVERMRRMCNELDNVLLVGSATSGRAALKMVRECAPQLLILDISMPDLGGLQLAQQIEKLRVPPAVIFCTAFDEYAIRAFDLAAVDYLLKPVASARLAKAVSRAAQYSSSKREALAGAQPVAEFWIPERGRLIRVATSQIERVEAEGNYMRLHLGERSVLLNTTITALQAQLGDERFMRVHRSHIVQRDLVVALIHDGLGSWSVQLVDGKKLRVGRSYLHAVRGMIRRKI
jgi:two-component system response regulator AlgR